MKKTKYNEKVFLDVIEHSTPTIVDKNYKKTTDKINIKYLK